MLNAAAFARVSALALCAAVAVPAQTITAQQVVDRIQTSVAIPWTTPTVDTFKAGDPATPVTGIAVTMMATLDVLERAVADGDNLVITHEPTFYDHQDRPEMDAGDPVLAAKRAFIAQHHLVIWRFHDHWHARHPDGVLEGMKHVLGWDAFQSATDPHLFALPPRSLRTLAHEVQSRLGIRAMRIVGDPAQRVKTVALLPGYAAFVPAIHAFELPQVDLVIAGETREWEAVEYAADAQTEGRHKALILLGHVPSEQSGMQECATWLKPILPGVRIDFVATAEPFWRP